ncbi:MAG: hypothetical protein KC925_02965 [Candidatus Doudnabacteria bacterium]|nr:hypothetical protein [Candidatus Doudnabacteria bacterium]
MNERNKLRGQPVALSEVERRWEPLRELFAQMLQNWSEGARTQAPPFEVHLIREGGHLDELPETIAQLRELGIARLIYRGRDDMWRVTVFLPKGDDTMTVVWEGKPTSGHSKEDLAVLLAFSRSLGTGGLDTASSSWPRSELLQTSLMALRSQKPEDGDRSGVEAILRACDMIKPDVEREEARTIMRGLPVARTLFGSGPGSVRSAFRTIVLQQGGPDARRAVNWPNVALVAGVLAIVGATAAYLLLKA